MFGVEPQPTGFPIGSDDLVRPSLRPHSSDIARALSLIDEAWLIVHRRSTNNVKQRDGRRNALDLLEETAVWMKDIDNG